MISFKDRDIIENPDITKKNMNEAGIFLPTLKTVKVKEIMHETAATCQKKA